MNGNSVTIVVNELETFSSEIDQKEATPSLPLSARTTCLPIDSTTTTTRPWREQKDILCKHWARYKECLYHARGICKFAHPSSTIPRCDPLSGNLPRHRTQSGRLQTRNDSRVAQFRTFVAETLPKGIVGARVLDVAGGKGELAYQLLHLCGVESCHVVDPRSLSLRRFQIRRERGFYHKSIFLHPEIVSKQEDDELEVGHLRCLFTQELWNGNSNNQDGEEEKVCEASFRETNGKATQAWVWPPPSKGDKSHHGNDRDDDDDPTQPQTPFPTYNHASSITQSATLILGMHPDQGKALHCLLDLA